jgi:transcriptional regulator with XRE-family HTH domain
VNDPAFPKKKTTTDRWEELGRLVREHRQALDIGVRELARRIDKSGSLIVRLEAGDGTVSDETLQRLAEVLGMSTSLIYGTVGRYPPELRPKNPAEVDVVKKCLRDYRGGDDV